MSVEKMRVVATYTAAADHFDDACAAFWGYFGRRTVERLALPVRIAPSSTCGLQRPLPFHPTAFHRPRRADRPQHGSHPLRSRSGVRRCGPPRSRRREV